MYIDNAIRFLYITFLNMKLIGVIQFILYIYIYIYHKIHFIFLVIQYTFMPKCVRVRLYVSVSVYLQLIREAAIKGETYMFCLSLASVDVR